MTEKGTKKISSSDKKKEKHIKKLSNAELKKFE